MTQKPAGSSAALRNATSVRPTFTPDVTGTYTVTLVVQASGVASQPDAVSMTAVTGNVPPVAAPGPTRSAAPGGSVTLDGTASHDPNHTPVTYTWRIVNQPPGSNPVLTNANTATPTFTADVPGIYTLELVVSDGTLSSLPVQTQCTVATGNLPPIGNAGPDQTVTTGQVVTLSAAGSSDPNGDPLTYTWCLQGRPDGSSVSLTGANTVQPTFAPDIPGSYVLCLTVSDGRGGTATDSVVVEATFPQTNAPVGALASDGSGGLFVAGQFTEIGNLPRRYIAHILPTGAVDPAWQPDPNGFVDVIHFSNGTLYVAGQFNAIGGAVRNCFAALDPNTGKVLPWDAMAAPNCSGVSPLVGINALLRTDNTLYAGFGSEGIGNDNLITFQNGEIRFGGAAFDAVTGALLPWNPHSIIVYTMGASASTVYIGGKGNPIGASFDRFTGVFLPWGPTLCCSPLLFDNSARLNTLVVSSDVVFLGGLFSQVSGQPRPALAAVDKVNAAPTAWRPAIAGGAVQALYEAGAALYVGGAIFLQSVPDNEVKHLLAVDKTTGQLLWDRPQPNANVRAIIVQNGRVYIGGPFTMVGDQVRNYFAVVDAATGELVGD
jgi:hypothetical protein